jgi:putative PEP-CTERM system TPR-repeat lipoprotein
MMLAKLGPQMGATSRERIDWLERARDAEPTSPQPALALANLYAQIGRQLQALDTVQKAYATNPDNPEVLEQLGIMQLAAGQKQQGLGPLSRLVASQPRSAVALLRLAGAQAANSDYKAAAETLRKALGIKPGMVEAQAALGDLEVRAGRFDQALAIARELQKQRPNAGIGYTLEGDAHTAQQNHAMAVRAYEVAHEKTRSTASFVKLHSAYSLAGRKEQAEQQLAAWLKEFPNDLGVRVYAADRHLIQRDFQAAIAQYQQLLQDHPDNPVILNNLAWAYQQVKDRRALETAQRAHELMPDDASIADTFGWILVQQGSVKRGVEVLRRAAATAPDTAEIRYHLAQALLKTGDRPSAKAELERLLNGGGTFGQRSEAMALLEQLGK